MAGSRGPSRGGGARALALADGVRQASAGASGPPDQAGRPAAIGLRSARRARGRSRTRSTARAAGILESPVVGVTTDEAQNRWVATRGALYLLRPGETSVPPLRRAPTGSTSAATRCATATTTRSARATRCGGELSSRRGARDHPHRRRRAGRGVRRLPRHRRDARREVPAEGHDEAGERGVRRLLRSEPPQREARPRPRPGGRRRSRSTASTSSRTAQGGEYWHDRTVQSLVFDHFVHPHTLYVGTNHGVTIAVPGSLPLSRARTSGSTSPTSSGWATTSTRASAIAGPVPRGQRGRRSGWATGPASPWTRTATSGTRAAGPPGSSPGSPIPGSGSAATARRSRSRSAIPTRSRRTPRGSRTSRCSRSRARATPST